MHTWDFVESFTALTLESLRFSSEFSCTSCPMLFWRDLMLCVLSDCSICMGVSSLSTMVEMTDSDIIKSPQANSPIASAENATI